jgi:hypothetical protein
MDMEGTERGETVKVKLAANSINTLLGNGSSIHPIRQIL